MQSVVHIQQNVQALPTNPPNHTHTALPSQHVSTPSRVDFIQHACTLASPAGQPVKVLAIGGSVTAGHGLKSLTAAYPARFGELLNATFPHPETDVLNRAIGGTTSSIFSLCFDQLVPQVNTTCSKLDWAARRAVMSLPPCCCCCWLDHRASCGRSI